MVTIFLFYRFRKNYFYKTLLMKSVVFRTNLSQRLLSLDFMRGFIMVLLALESTGLYEHLSECITTGFNISWFHATVLSSSMEWIAFLGSYSTRLYVYGRRFNGIFLKKTKAGRLYMEQVF